MYHKFLLLQSEGQLSESLDVSLELLSCYFRNVESHSNPVVLLDKKRARQNFPNLSEGKGLPLIVINMLWSSLCSGELHVHCKVDCTVKVFESVLYKVAISI